MLPLGLLGAAGGGGLPGMSDQSMSSATLNANGPKSSGINIGGTREIPQFITARMGQTTETATLGTPALLIALAAVGVAGYLVWRR